MQIVFILSRAFVQLLSEATGHLNRLNTEKITAQKQNTKYETKSEQKDFFGLQFFYQKRYLC
jgi:hypothetical protein